MATTYTVGSQRGSSPLTRGKPQTPKHHAEGSRLIPAHAGKTPAFSSASPGQWAHPRSRGENAPRGRPARARWGSSPLTRGKHGLGLGLVGGQGLIPAHAGKTSLFLLLVCLGWAHPRSRGENAEYERDYQKRYGSSPLTRGKHRHAMPMRVPHGLIPAHAGKTVVLSCAFSLAGAHPRSRGENRPANSKVSNDTGSSPLTRGKRIPVKCDGECNGLIPAHAGKTPPKTPRVKTPKAHPRSRGENIG